MKNGVKMFERASVGGLMCSTSGAGKAEKVQTLDSRTQSHCKQGDIHAVERHVVGSKVQNLHGLGTGSQNEVTRV